MRGRGAVACGWHVLRELFVMLLVLTGTLLVKYQKDE